jgi:hypothetical protein
MIDNQKDPPKLITGPSYISGLMYWDKFGNSHFSKCDVPILVAEPNEAWIEKYGEFNWEEYLKNIENGNNKSKL